MARCAGRHLAAVTNGPMDALPERQQGVPEYGVIVRATQTSLGLELHILYAARRAGQPRQLIGRRPNVLRDHRLYDARQVQFLLFEDLLLFRALIAKVELSLLAVHDL